MTVRVAQHYGVGRFRDGADFYKAGSGSTPGSALMTVAVVAQMLRAPSSVNQNIASTTFQNLLIENGDQGWRLERLSSDNYRVTLADGGGSFITAQVAASSLVEGPGQILLALFSHDGDTLRIRIAGQTDSQAAGTSGFTPGGPLAIGVESEDEDEPAIDFGVLALVASENQALSAAQLTTLQSDLEDNLTHGRDFDSGLTDLSPEVYYDAADLALDPTTWADRLGGAEDLVQNGSPELFAVSARVGA